MVLLPIKGGDEKVGGKQPTPQCRQEVRSQNSSRAKGSPIISRKPWCSMTSPQGGSFGNPFPDGGTHNLRKGETARTGGSGATNKKGCSKQPRTPSPHTKVPRAQLDRPNVDYSKLSRHGSQLKNLQCSANSRLSVAKGSRNKNVRRQVSKGKLLGSSSAPNLVSQEHRTSVANQRRSTINATQISNTAWKPTKTSRSSNVFGLDAFEERNLHQKNVPNNSAYNKVSRPSPLQKSGPGVGTYLEDVDLFNEEESREIARIQTKAQIDAIIVHSVCVDQLKLELSKVFAWGSPTKSRSKSPRLYQLTHEELYGLLNIQLEICRMEDIKSLKQTPVPDNLKFFINSSKTKYGDLSTQEIIDVYNKFHKEYFTPGANQDPHETKGNLTMAVSKIVNGAKSVSPIKKPLSLTMYEKKLTREINSLNLRQITPAGIKKHEEFHLQKLEGLRNRVYELSGQSTSEKGSTTSKQTPRSEAASQSPQGSSEDDDSFFDDAETSKAWWTQHNGLDEFATGKSTWKDVLNKYIPRRSTSQSPPWNPNFSN